MKAIILFHLLLLIPSTILLGQGGGVTVFPAIPAVNNSTVRFNDTGFDNDKRLWVASANFGIAVYDSVSTSWDTLKMTSGLPSDSVICMDFSGAEVWIGTKMGAVRYSGAPGQGGNIIATYGTPQLPSAEVTAVLAENNEVWFGTYFGLAKLNISANSWSYFTFTNDSVTRIHRDDNGLLWVGTRNGLNMSSDNGLSWTAYTPTNTGNVLSSVIFDIEHDVFGRVWISSGTSFSQLMTCSVSYLLSGTWNSFNLHDFEYGYVSGNAVGPNLNFTKNNFGEVMFAISGMMTIRGKCIAVGSCDLRFFSIEDFGSIVCQGSNLHGFIFDVMPNGEVFRLTRLRYCGLSFEYNNIIKPITTLALFPIPSQNSCDGCGANPPSGMSEIDINLVKANIISGADMHWDLNEAQYEVPKGSGLNTIYASSLWIGGLDQGGQIRAAAQTYRQTGIDFWAGPIDGLNIPAGDSTAKYFDRIFKISKWEIESFKNHFQAGTVSFQPCNNNVAIGIINWPAKGNGPITGDLAPFVDVDGNGFYNPLTGGDYPLIKGDQMLFKVYNDSLNVHTETGGDRLGFEFRTSVYGYLCNGISQTSKVLNYTTLYNTEIINKSTQNYTEVYFGLFVDADLGNYLDDRVGCDVGRNAGFTYNGDIDDETSSGYGLNPPIMNVKFLRGTPAITGDGIDNDNDGLVDEPGERTAMNTFLTWQGSPTATGNPSNHVHHYNYIKGAWLDGKPLTYGGYGYDPVSTDTCHFMFPDTTDPVYYPTHGAWSELTIGKVSGARHFVISSGPFNLNAGDTVSFDYAYIFSRDSLTGGNMNFALNNYNLDLVQSWFDNDNFPSCEVYSTGLDENGGKHFSVYPNPTTGVFHFAEATNQLAGSRYELFTIVGERVKTGVLKENLIDISHLPSQVYILKIHSANKTFVARVVKF